MRMQNSFVSFFKILHIKSFCCFCYRPFLYWADRESWLLLFCDCWTEHSISVFYWSISYKNLKTNLKIRSDNTAMNRYTQTAALFHYFSFCQKSLHFPIWKHKTTNIENVPENVAQHLLLLHSSKCQQIPEKVCTVVLDLTMKFLYDEVLS